jgi:hypothetical protein
MEPRLRGEWPGGQAQERDRSKGDGRTEEGSRCDPRQRPKKEPDVPENGHPQLVKNKQREEHGTRGRPSATAANSYLEFTACKSQKFGHWANIRPLLEKAKKLIIFIGNSAPLKTFLLKNLEKFDYRFFRKQKLFIGPF